MKRRNCTTNFVQNALNATLLVALVATSSFATTRAAEVKPKHTDCDPEWDRLLRAQLASLKAVGPIVLKFDVSFVQIIHALGSSGSKRAQGARETWVSWFAGPSDYRTGNLCMPLGGDNSLIYSAVDAGFSTQGSSTLERARPFYLSVSLPFAGTVDGLSLGQSVSRFLKQATAGGWKQTRSGEPQLVKGTTMLTYRVDENETKTVIHMGFIDTHNVSAFVENEVFKSFAPHGPAPVSQ